MTSEKVKQSCHYSDAYLNNVCFAMAFFKSPKQLCPDPTRYFCLHDTFHGGCRMEHFPPLYPDMKVLKKLGRRAQGHYCSILLCVWSVAFFEFWAHYKQKS